MFDQPLYQLSMAKACVYMLRCVDGSLYTGWTVDVQRRLARHQAGAASRYTASRLPVELARVQEIPDRRAARQEEVLIKKSGEQREARTASSGNSSTILRCCEHRVRAPRDDCSSIGPPVVAITDRSAVCSSLTS
jgi:putative endonuclease